jgi:NAD+ synthase (glutamine-hydrolysing)
VQKNVFKRVQSPPIIVTSKTSFGYDLRESMLPYDVSERQRALKSEILSMKSYYDE